MAVVRYSTTMFHFNIESLLQSGGLLFVAFIVFAESGLLVGFFLPGDSLLFPAGLFAAQGKLPIIGLILSVIAAAVIGDNVGYSIGRRAGPRLFRKQDGILFRKEYIERAEAFYERHGGKTIIMARFVPVMRTLAPVVAGVGKMPRKRFVLFNIIGGALWGGGVTLAGYWLGSKIPNVDKYVLPTVLLAILISVGPAVYHLLKDRRTRQALAAKIRLAISSIFLNKK